MPTPDTGSVKTMNETLLSGIEIPIYIHGHMICNCLQKCSETQYRQWPFRSDIQHIHHGYPFYPKNISKRWPWPWAQPTLMSNQCSMTPPELVHPRQAMSFPNPVQPGATIWSTTTASLLLRSLNLIQIPLRVGKLLPSLPFLPDWVSVLHHMPTPTHAASPPPHTNHSTLLPLLGTLRCEGLYW